MSTDSERLAYSVQNANNFANFKQLFCILQHSFPSSIGHAQFYGSLPSTGATAWFSLELCLFANCITVNGWHRKQSKFYLGFGIIQKANKLQQMDIPRERHDSAYLLCDVVIVLMHIVRNSNRCIYGYLIISNKMATISYVLCLLYGCIERWVAIETLNAIVARGRQVFIAIFAANLQQRCRSI